MVQSLLARFRILFLSFVLLMVASVGLMYWELGRQRQDAVVINIAGRQRMLVQQITRLAVDAVETGSPETRSALAGARRLFEESLRVLRNGGTAPDLPSITLDLPPTRDPAIRRQIEGIYQSWWTYLEALDALQAVSPGEAGSETVRAELEPRSAALLNESNSLVLLYQAESVSRVTRLRNMEIGSFLGTLLLLAAGAWVTERSVLGPVRALRAAAQRIGNHDLDIPISLAAPQEMEELATALNEMQQRLKASRSELITLTDTLEQRVAQRTRELEALNDVSREISSQLNVQQVLDSVTEKARSLLNADIASLCLLDDSSRWLNLRALSGPRSAVTAETAPAREHFASSVLAGQKALPGENCTAGGCRMLAPEYRGSHLAAPLRSGSQVIGALCVGSSTAGRFSGEATGILSRLANTAAVALENARLYARAERVAALEERNRIAAEIHDGLGQTLSYLGLMTDQVIGNLEQDREAAALDQLQRTREAIEKAVDDTRRAIDNLVNEPTRSTDLSAVLGSAVADLAGGQNLPVIWKPQIEGPVHCAPATARQVLNITREAIHNAARHAQAATIWVKLGEMESQPYVSVDDDGRGFDTTLPSPAGHFGLQIMHARAAQIGGRLEIVSRPGQGTRVTLFWPGDEG